MRFERSLHPFVATHTPIRDTDDHLDFTHMQRGFLMTATLEDFIEDAIVFDENSTLPDLIKVRCELRPTFQTHNVYGTCSHNGRPYDPCPLYQPDRLPLTHMDVVLGGMVSILTENVWHDGTRGVEGHCVRHTPEDAYDPSIVYRKYFSSLKSSINLTTQIASTPSYRGLYFEPNGGEEFHETIASSILEEAPLIEDLVKSRPLWGYGGAYTPSIKIEDIVQYYVSLEHGDKDTTTLLYRHADGLKHNSSTHIKGKGWVHAVNPILPYVESSLYEDLVVGRSSILYQGHIYTSLAVEQMGNTPILIITYAPKRLKLEETI